MNHRARCGLALMELVLAMLITSLIGLSVAGACRVLSDSYCRSEDYYRSLQSARIAMLNLQSQVHQAHLVTDAASGRLMIWREPPGGNGRINLSELVLIRYDPAEDTLTQYQVVLPDWLPPLLRLLLDFPVELRDLVESPSFWANVVRTGLWTQARPLAAEISDFRVVPAGAPPLTPLVTTYLTAGAGAEAVHLRNSAAPRADRRGFVRVQGNHYVLDQ